MDADTTESETPDAADAAAASAPVPAPATRCPLCMEVVRAAPETCPSCTFPLTPAAQAEIADRARGHMLKAPAAGQYTSTSTDRVMQGVFALGWPMLSLASPYFGFFALVALGWSLIYALRGQSLRALEHFIAALIGCGLFVVLMIGQNAGS